MFNAICAGFTSPPDQCLKTLHKERAVKVPLTVARERSVRVGTIIAAVVGLVLVNALIVYLCRRKAKRDMNNEMQMQIEMMRQFELAARQRAGDIPS